MGKPDHSLHGRDWTTAGSSAGQQAYRLGEGSRSRPEVQISPRFIEHPQGRTGSKVGGFVLSDEWFDIRAEAYIKREAPVLIERGNEHP